MSAVELLFFLLGWHCLADYPLQGDFLAKAKNPLAPVPGVPWWQAMWSHALIHGAGVAALTGIWWLGLLEMFAHALIDEAKCRHWISFREDQGLHVACKFVWLWVAIA